MINEILKRKREALHSQIMSTARDAISTIEFSTHRAIFNLGFCDFDRLQNIFDLEYPPQNNKSASKYSKRFKGSFMGKKVILFAFPKGRFLPYFMIKINDTDFDIFKSLYNKFGDEIKISNIEYRLDFFCHDNIEAGKLFAILRWYLYFPRKQATSIVGGNFTGMDIDRNENCVMHVWNDKKYKRKYITLYERGPDSKKQRYKNKNKFYWSHEDVDRVRFEYKVNKKKDNKNINLSSLSKFIKDPNFRNVMLPHFNFKVFQSKKGLPEPYAYNYETDDIDGNSECFQIEYLAAKDKNIRPSDHTATPKDMAWLLNKIDQALIDAEERWQRKVKKYNIR